MERGKTGQRGPRADPLSYALVVALVLAVAVGAAWVPARRATRIALTSALRAE